VIPDEAVEAAAKAIYATEAQPMYDESKEEFTGARPWEWLTERSWDVYRDKARLALEAAAPHMMAVAWEAGRQDGHMEAQSGFENAMNPYERFTP
jgi:hypothetical protein